MITKSIQNLKDFLHAKLCYQIFITPIHLHSQRFTYRDHIHQACEYLANKRDFSQHIHTPRHHVIHSFIHPEPRKKILIIHGWVSRAAYMAHFIQTLHAQGFEVHALDLPAHGEAVGIQLNWLEAVTIIHQTMNHLGPFYGVIGHSFGGSMLLNALNLASQFDSWQLTMAPKRAVLIASPSRMSVPVRQIARQLKLNKKAYAYLREMFKQDAEFALSKLHLHHYTQAIKTKFLCVHGEADQIVLPEESVLFCNHHPEANLSLLPGIDHINILFADSASQSVKEFLSDE